MQKIESDAGLRERVNEKWHAAAASLVVVAIYYLSNPQPQSYYDYTFRVARSLLNGSVGLAQTPPSWLNEFVPLGGYYYSVFPLGSVLSMMPFAALASLGVISVMPGAFIGAFTAGTSTFFLWLISGHYKISQSKRAFMVAGIMFGTWTWANVTMAGAWQLALGIALTAELAAVYFTVFSRRPLVAGMFFAIAFGNRTEILLTAPLFLFLLGRREATPRENSANEPEALPAIAARLARFCAVPLVLGIATLAYNDSRFGSMFDFGYARIPGVLEEPWYRYGIFSYRYIPRQMWEMLLRPWEFRNSFPFLAPNAFSSSVLLSSPFLLLAFRRRSRDRLLKYTCWLAVALICLLLWTHGNSGGWQFGYRYAIVCLPWLFVILLETAELELSRLELALYLFSFSANLYATWLFNWTNYLRP